MRSARDDGGGRDPAGCGGSFGETGETTIETFAAEGKSFVLNLATIGAPGNPADPETTYGHVAPVFRIGKYELSTHKVARAVANGLSGFEGLPLTGSGPMTDITWLQAAGFVNWLNEDQGYHRAYRIEDGKLKTWPSGEPGYDTGNPIRDTRAMYWFPTEDQWYKAAYYSPASGTWYDYATDSDTPPTAVVSGTDPGTAVYESLYLEPPGLAVVHEAGGLSPFGTMGQNGNAREWLENRAIRGGMWHADELLMASKTRSVDTPHARYISTGFRVAAHVPGSATYAVARAGEDRVALGRVQLDGTESYAPASGGALVDYEWTLTQHGTGTVVSAHGAETEADVAAGFWDVELVVTDEYGTQGTDKFLLASSGPVYTPGELADAVAAAPGPDVDGDGFTDDQELDCGTDPPVYEIRLVPGWNSVSAHGYQTTTRSWPCSKA